MAREPWTSMHDRLRAAAFLVVVLAAPGTSFACTSANHCDDGNQCTTDTCDSVLGCLSVVRTGPCDDRNPCTVNDTCENGVCAGTAVNCDDANLCNGVEYCDVKTGQCVPGTPPTCDDGVICTVGATRGSAASTIRVIPGPASCPLLPAP